MRITPQRPYSVFVCRTVPYDTVPVGAKIVNPIHIPRWKAAFLWSSARIDHNRPWLSVLTSGRCRRSGTWQALKDFAIRTDCRTRACTSQARTIACVRSGGKLHARADLAAVVSVWTDKSRSPKFGPRTDPSLLTFGFPARPAAKKWAGYSLAMDGPVEEFPVSTLHSVLES